MASTTKATFADGAELGMRCLTNIEYGIVFRVEVSLARAQERKEWHSGAGRGTQGARIVKQEVHTIGSLTATGAVIADDFSQTLKHVGPRCACDSFKSRDTRARFVG